MTVSALEITGYCCCPQHAVCRSAVRRRLHQSRPGIGVAADPSEHRPADRPAFIVANTRTFVIIIVWKPFISLVTFPVAQTDADRSGRSTQHALGLWLRSTDFTSQTGSM